MRIGEQPDWVLLWNVLLVMVQNNGVVGPDRSSFLRSSLTLSKATTASLCRIFMEHSSASTDLPPNELPNPDPATSATDLIAIQDLLLEGRVGFRSACDAANRSHSKSHSESSLGSSSSGFLHGRRSLLSRCLPALLQGTLPTAEHARLNSPPSPL